MIAIEDTTTEDCTFNVAVIGGGRWVNCVPINGTAEALSMAKRQADLDRGVADMLALAGLPGGAAFHVARGVTRPVWEPDAAGLALYGWRRMSLGGLGLHCCTTARAAAWTAASAAR